VDDEAVGAALRARRVALGLTQDDLDGVSSSTIRKAERGELGMRDLTRAAYMRGLQWPNDAIERLRRDGVVHGAVDPAPPTSGQADQGWSPLAGASGISPETWANLSEDDRRRVVEFAENLRQTRKP
jgi:transcriptional regulator with XRE-family HTH domain